MSYDGSSFHRALSSGLHDCKGKLTFAAINLPLGTVGQDCLSASCSTRRGTAVDRIGAVLWPKAGMMGLLVVAHVASLARDSGIYRDTATLGDTLSYAVLEVSSPQIEAVGATAC